MFSNAMKQQNELIKNMVIANPQEILLFVFCFVFKYGFDNSELTIQLHNRNQNKSNLKTIVVFFFQIYILF